MSFNIIDRRKFVQVHPRGRTRPQGERPLSDVNAIVLHQMSFTRGNDQSRYDPTTAHFAILQDGTTLLLHDATTYLHSSNGLNARSVAVEFAGVFPNDRGRYHRTSAARYGEHTLSQAQAKAGRMLLLHVKGTLGVRFVFAHRQANYPTKANCPGPHIWYNVGQWALTRGFSDGGPGFFVAGGTPIPDAWRDPGMSVF